MKILYYSVLSILLVVMVGMSIIAQKKQTDIAKSLSRLTFTAAFTVITSVIAALIPSEEVGLFFKSLHYATIEWVLIFLMAFFERYTKRDEGSFKIKMTIFIISGISTVNLLLNAVFHHALSCQDEVVKGVHYRIFYHIFPWYHFHLWFCYLLVLFSILTLLGAMVSTKSFYRIKYWPAMLAIIMTAVIEGICSARNEKMDYSLFGYLGLGIFLIYFTIYHVFKGLLTNTLSYVSSDAKSGVVCFDLDGNCTYVNDLVKEVFPGIEEASDYNPLDEEEKAHYLLGESTHSWTMERGEGEKRRIYEITYSKIKDNLGDSIGKYYRIYDKTEDVTKYEEAKYRATHDVLTGLYNATTFYEMVEQRLEKQKRYPQGVYLVVADIKDFKLINDLFGYDKGNEILAAFADTLGNFFSDKAIGCRMNSDVFSFFVPKEELDEEKILTNISKIKDILGEDNFQIVYHFGVYTVRETDRQANILYDYARIALRGIKNSYDQCFAYYDDEMMRNLMVEKTFISEFDKAIEEEQFHMFLQPQVTMDGTMIGAEALVRWIHPQKGMISPGEFIPVFEKSSLIYKLDMYMWRKAAEKLKEWAENGKEEYYISVNISPIDFYHLDIYKVITDIVKEYKITPNRLKLEITESAFMENPKKQIELINKLQRYGFQVEIDDFGSGYSSLNMLKDMNANVLKIDMGFLRKTSETGRTGIILDQIITMAKRLDMVVVTEGVETVEQVDYLKNIGCDIIQGYYFSKPINVIEFEHKYFD